MPARSKWRLARHANPVVATRNELTPSVRKGPAPQRSHPILMSQLPLGPLWVVRASGIEEPCSAVVEALDEGVVVQRIAYDRGRSSTCGRAHPVVLVPKWLSRGVSLYRQTDVFDGRGSVGDQPRLPGLSNGLALHIRLMRRGWRVVLWELPGRGGVDAGRWFSEARVSPCFRFIGSARVHGWGVLPLVLPVRCVRIAIPSVSIGRRWRWVLLRRGSRWYGRRWPRLGA